MTARVRWFRGFLGEDIDPACPARRRPLGLLVAGALQRHSGVEYAGDRDPLGGLSDGLLLLLDQPPKRVPKSDETLS
ncbi:MAG TPA: hypothetical protein PK280_18235, partial [Planctomycetota bacterium]|nr:hypothetical protein [Planctomycetota bacterium]